MCQVRDSHSKNLVTFVQILKVLLLIIFHSFLFVVLIFFPGQYIQQATSNLLLARAVTLILFCLALIDSGYWVGKIVKSRPACVIGTIVTGLLGMALLWVFMDFYIDPVKIELTLSSLLNRYVVYFFRYTEFGIYLILLVSLGLVAMLLSKPRNK